MRIQTTIRCDLDSDAKSEVKYLLTDVTIRLMSNQVTDGIVTRRVEEYNILSAKFDLIKPNIQLIHITRKCPEGENSLRL